MRFPTVHRNGTSGEALYALHVTACDRLRDAIRALDAAAPNGRDFYVQGDHAIGEAMREHVERVSKLSSVLRDVAAIVEEIAEQRAESESLRLRDRVADQVLDRVLVGEP